MTWSCCDYCRTKTAWTANVAPRWTRLTTRRVRAPPPLASKRRRPTNRCPSTANSSSSTSSIRSISSSFNNSNSSNNSNNSNNSNFSISNCISSSYSNNNSNNNSNSIGTVLELRCWASRAGVWGRRRPRTRRRRSTTLRCDRPTSSPAWRPPAGRCSRPVPAVCAARRLCRPRASTVPTAPSTCSASSPRLDLSALS